MAFFRDFFFFFVKTAHIIWYWLHFRHFIFSLLVSNVFCYCMHICSSASHCFKVHIIFVCFILYSIYRNEQTIKIIYILRLRIVMAYFEILKGKQEGDFLMSWINSQTLVFDFFVRSKIWWKYSEKKTKMPSNFVFKNFVFFFVQISNEHDARSVSYVLLPNQRNASSDV